MADVRHTSPTIPALLPGPKIAGPVQLDMLNRNRMEHGNGLSSTSGAFVLSWDWRWASENT